MASRSGTGPEATGSPVGDGSTTFNSSYGIPTHYSGFGASNHPIVPNGRTVSSRVGGVQGGKKALAGEHVSKGHGDTKVPKAVS